MKNKLLPIFILFLSISCSPITSSWSCKSDLKGSCKSISEIDKGYTENAKASKDEENLKAILAKEQKKTKAENVVIEEGSLNDFRSKESVARVKFSPYVDEAGNRHDSSVVYYLEQKAEWRK